MTGYQKLLAQCSEEEKMEMTNAIQFAGNTHSCIITHLDTERGKKIVVVRPPLYEKWAVSIADLEKKETKIINEDGIIEYLCGVK